MELSTLILEQNKKIRNPYYILDRFERSKKTHATVPVRKKTGSRKRGITFHLWLLLHLISFLAQVRKCISIEGFLPGFPGLN